jgi:hypothetical protein
MTEDLLKELYNIAPDNYNTAKFVHTLFKDEYKCHVFGKSYIWFQKEVDGTWKKIESIVIRNRLSTDVVTAINKLRSNFKNSPEYTRIESIASNNKSLETLNINLKKLMDTNQLVRDAFLIDEAREIQTQIRDTEISINLITMKQDLQRADFRDKIFARISETESKLYNTTFKDGVMKELAGFFYVTDS